MTPLRRAVRLSLILGGISILGLIMGLLALTDIGHGERDLSLEWGVLRAAFLAIMLFQGSALITLGRVYRVLRSPTPLHKASRPSEGAQPRADSRRGDAGP